MFYVHGYCCSINNRYLLYVPLVIYSIKASVLMAIEYFVDGMLYTVASKTYLKTFVIHWNLYKDAQISSFACHSLYKIAFILPVMKDHLSWQTTTFSGRFIQVSLYVQDFMSFKVCTCIWITLLRIPQSSLITNGLELKLCFCISVSSFRVDI